jgi:hypothetical protein
MLYYVELNDLAIFKGNYYACVDFIATVQVGADNLKITNRK